MQGHYISFKDENNAGNEILRVYPAELRRQYLPQSTDRTMSVGNFTVQVIQMTYKVTDCIIHLGTPDGAICLVDALSVILEEHEVVTATFMPCSVTMCIDVTEEKEIEHLKKMIYFMFPNIKNTSKYGVHHLIELDAAPVGVLARPTRTARPREIPQVTAIPMDG